MSARRRRPLLPPRALLALLSLLTMSLAACPGEPTSCEEAACDGETEMCVLFGSDTLEPPSASCQPLPVACEDDPTCACLDQNTGEDEANRFCLDTGGCSVEGDVLMVVCPGG